MLEDVRSADLRDGVYVESVAAGTVVAGEYHCSDCGYGVTLRAVLPACPMCSGTSWDQVAWSPFTRARRLQ
jgi:rubredoxin